jgi:hypothetical protein
VIWSSPQPGGITLEVSVAYKPLKGYRSEHEFMVRTVDESGAKKPVCKVGEDGRPKVWFVAGKEQEGVLKAIEDLPNALLVELVSAY